MRLLQDCCLHQCRCETDLSWKPPVWSWFLTRVYEGFEFGGGASGSDLLGSSSLPEEQVEASRWSLIWLPLSSEENNSSSSRSGPDLDRLVLTRPDPPTSLHRQALQNAAC